jgi:hypothetical protein
MMKTILVSIILVAMGDVTVHAAPMVKETTAKCALESKQKKRRTFKRLMAKSLGFVASSAVMGGMSDR